jgi:hypothetical protein
MTDDLVKRADAFRLGSRPTDQQVDQANRLIDRMSSRIEKLEAKLAKAVEALKKIETGLPVGSSLFDGKNPLWRDAYRDLQRIARITLAELKGETS